MKKIIIKLAILVLSLLIVDRVLGYLFGKFIFSRTYSGESGGNLNYFFKKKNDVDFVIIGSSRAKNMINPKLLTALNGEGYNAGINGVGAILYMNSFVDVMVNMHVKPKYIILQTDLRNYYKKKSENYRSQIAPLYPYIDHSKVLRSYSNGLGFEEKLKLKLLLYRYNGIFYNVFTNYIKKEKINKDGYTPLRGIIDPQKDLQTNEDTTQIFNFNLEKIQALYDIIDRCKENNIRLFIVMPPSYNNTLYNEKKLAQLKTMINEKYKVDLFDMTDVSQFADLKDYRNWKDILHLNTIGADKFSNYLNDSINTRLSKQIQ